MYRWIDAFHSKLIIQNPKTKKNSAIWINLVARNFYNGKIIFIL